MLTTTPATLGLDRARPGVHATFPSVWGWCGGSVAPRDCGCTGLVGTAFMSNADEIADTVGTAPQTKRPTRHLGRRST